MNFGGSGYRWKSGCGFGKCTLRIAVAEGSVAATLPAEPSWNNRRVRRQRFQWVNIGGKRTIRTSISRRHPRPCNLSDADDHGNRFAHIPQPAPRRSASIRSALDADDEAGCQGLDVVAGQDRERRSCARAAAKSIERISACHVASAGSRRKACPPNAENRR